jgi:hypothetical protein
MASATVSELTSEQRRFNARLYLILLPLAVLTAVLYVIGALALGITTVTAVLVILILLGVIAFRPIAAFYLIAVCVVIIEQEPIQFSIVTDKLYVYYWPTNLAGLPERPIGLLFLYALFVVALRNFATRRPLLRAGGMMGPLLALMATVGLGVLHGLASGGNFKIIVLELRSFEYLFLGYVLAYNLIASKQHIVNFFWIVIAGAGIKGLQGTYIVFVQLHGHFATQNEIMAHEESFFWVALLLLIILFNLRHKHKAQLRLALVELPFVIIGLVANNRRADYVALIIGVAVAWVLVIAVRREGRGGRIAVLAIVGSLAAAYILIFSHVSGSLGLPARGIIATFQPSASDLRDAQSNLYRVYEDSDLLATYKASPLLGWGFGKPFLQPNPLPNIITLDPYYLYIPHNTILWVLMRLGPLGFIALWNLVGTLIIRGCHIARELVDPYLQLVAVYIVAIVVMEIILAYADYQLYFYRNVIYMGILAAILVKLPSIDAEQSGRQHAVPSGKARAPVQLSGSRLMVEGTTVR